MSGNGRRDESGGERDNLFGGLMRGLRDFVTQIADPTAPPRPQPVAGPGRRPPRQSPRTFGHNGSGVREPVVDLFDEGDLIRIVADMPGADPATVRVRGTGTRLAIAAGGPARRYERIVSLPAPILEGAGYAPTFINGILEVLLPVERRGEREEVAPQEPAPSRDAARADRPEPA